MRRMCHAGVSVSSVGLKWKVLEKEQVWRVRTLAAGKLASAENMAGDCICC